MVETNNVKMKNFDNDDESDAPKSFVVDASEMSSISGLPNSSEKPKYPKAVELDIESVSVKKGEIKEDSNGEKYFTARVILKYSDMCQEGLSGLRVYVDKDGKPERVWNGPQSAYGEIKSMLEAFTGTTEKFSLDTFCKELHGRKVKVRTKEVVFGTQKYYKNMPIEFLERGE